MFDDRSVQMRRILGVYDICFITIAFLSSLGIENLFFPREATNILTLIAPLPLILSFFIFTLPHFGAYRSPRTSSGLSYIWAVGQSIFISLGTLLLFLFLFNIPYVSVRLIFISATIIFLGMSGARLYTLWYFRNSLKSGRNFRKILIIGSGERAESLAKALKNKAEWGLDIVGHLDPDPTRVGLAVNDSRVIGTTTEIDTILKNQVIDEVILAIPRSMFEDVEDIAFACQEGGVNFRLMADVFTLSVARISLTSLGRIPLLTLEPVSLEESKLLVKRILDFVVTLAAMPVFLPIMGVIALAIKLDDKGPIFFIQERVGLKKRTFPMYKFRSMRADAESMLKDIEHLNEAEGPNFKITNDPRVTKIGNFLRKTSLDELPQLFNVLRGDMSLVGPRPMSLRDVDLFDKRVQRKRFSVKPGLTCIWQISGRSNLPFSKWLELDLEYIENWSLLNDFFILLKTIPAVLFRKGAV